jgi:hypothetical protein
VAGQSLCFYLRHYIFEFLEFGVVVISPEHTIIPYLAWLAQDVLRGTMDHGRQSMFAPARFVCQKQT